MNNKEKLFTNKIIELLEKIEHTEYTLRELRAELGIELLSKTNRQPIDRSTYEED